VAKISLKLKFAKLIGRLLVRVQPSQEIKFALYIWECRLVAMAGVSKTPE
jgi:hypothetical protein